MNYIIITSFKEPKSTVKAVESILNQDFKEDFKIIVVDPFPETEKFIKKNVRSKKVEFFLDPGEGKSYALNLLIEQYYSNDKNEIFIFTDGDVYLSKKSISEILNEFSDGEVGCVTGRPVSVDSKDNKYGYWSHFLFAGIDKARKKLSNEKKFFECSGYLFAMRNGVITKFPLETSEDSIIPYLFWKKGYKIKYSENAEVYVKNPGNWKDWINQKVRNIKAHENLNKLAPNMPRTKSLFNEMRYGLSFFFAYPKNIKEIIWTIQLYFARIYIYFKAFAELGKRKGYSDGWRDVEIKSTKPLD